MPRLLYAARSSFSGSTLFAFLLNLHPEICSVGHMTGWPRGDDGYIRCSCGASLEACPFFRHIREVYIERHLPFEFDDFGTRYRLATNNRLNRYLTAGLPDVHFRWIERTRDAIVRMVPGYAERLALHERANLAFIEAALAYKNAKIFVDNSQTAYRLRHLRRIATLDIVGAHLVRDFRGVVLSNMRRRGWSPVLATRMWLREQSDIVRIMREVPASITVRYEDLCDATDETLAKVHRFVGLAPQPFGGDFKSAEHHVLGNAMRLKDGMITKDRRWRQELSGAELDSIVRIAESFMRNHSDDPVSLIVAGYLQQT